MRAKHGKALLITILASICILIQDAGTCLHALADDNTTVIGSTVVVGGKAVVMVDSGALSVSQLLEPELEESEATAESTSQQDFSPSIEPIRDGKLADAAYYKRSSLSAYEFPNSDITEIGDFAFARSGLETIVIPEGVTKIGYGAFYHCEKLMQVEIPSSVTEIEPFAFQDAAWLTNWRKDQQDIVAKGKEAFLIVGDGVLLAYEGNKQAVILPDTIKRIAGNAFYQNTQMRSVLLPSSLLEIGEGAFEGCSALSKVTGGKNVQIIRDRAFAGCPISEISLPGGLKQIGFHVYDYPGAVVSFQGNSLPQMIYSERATRLTNDSYRQHTFEGATVAIIKKSVKSTRGTVLDPTGNGFAGVVCQLATNRVSDRAGELNVIQVNGRVEQCPAMIRFSGRNYRIQDVAGLVPESKDTVLPAGLTLRCETDSLKPKNLVEISLLQPFSASLEFSIEENRVTKEKLALAYLQTYGQELAGAYYGYCLTLTDRNCQIPIVRLGSNHMMVTLPVPKDLYIDSVHVATFDSNELLKEIPCVVTRNGEFTRITFEIDKIAPILLY